MRAGGENFYVYIMFYIDDWLAYSSRERMNHAECGAHLYHKTILPCGSEFCIGVYGHAVGDDVTCSRSIVCLN